MSAPTTGAPMSIAEHALQRSRMSWEEYLRLPEKPKAEYVDGEVVVTPPVTAAHGVAAVCVGSALRAALPHLLVMTEVGVALPRNRLRAPDLMVVEAMPEGAWVSETPVLVVEVLSPSTRTEDTVRKAHEYAAGGIGQYWIVDPEAGVLEVFEQVEDGGGGWDRLLRLDSASPAGEVAVADHGVVALDVREVLPGSFV